MSDPTLTEPVMRAFHAELQKEAGGAGALIEHLRRPGTRNAMLSGVGSGLGLGLGAGAVGGGALGARESYLAARDRGEGRVVSALSALGGGVGGALRGAAKGAVIGAGAGALSGAVSPTNTIRGARAISKAPNSVGSLSNFGQRQVHSLTGWKPGGAHKSVERIGAGAADARKTLSAARAGGDAAQIARAEKGLAAAEKAQSMGMTSLPGLAGSVNKNGLLPTLSAGFHSQWDASGPKGKALMLGLPAWSLLSATRDGDSPDGRGRGERIGRIVGGTVGGMTAPLSLAGGLVLGGALERGGGAIGKRFDRKRAARPAVPQEPTPPPDVDAGANGSGSAVPTERIYGTGVTGPAHIGGME